MNEKNYKPMVPYMPLIPKVANAYVPFQLNSDMYDPKEGLMNKGTIFEALYSPFNITLKGSDTVCK